MLRLEVFVALATAKSEYLRVVAHENDSVAWKAKLGNGNSSRKHTRIYVARAEPTFVNPHFYMRYDSTGYISEARE